MEGSLEQKNMDTKINLKEEIIADCAKDTTNEVCGFIFEDDNQLKMRSVKNRSLNPDKEFYIPSKDFLFFKKKYNLVGIYHSHTRGTEKPSEYDEKTSDLICYPFIIYSLKKDKFHVHVPEVSDADPKHLEELKEVLK
jgi:proteasome lid subunit RPN8/RPN11